MIPNIFHFVFGLAEDFGGKPFSLCHYLAIKSALDNNKDFTARLYYKYKPTGKWFEKIEPELELVPITPPKEIFGRPLLHIAHQTGVIRLQVLLEHGGIYMDLDTICVKSFKPLLNNPCVLGIQGENVGHVEGLCDGVILAQRGSLFLKHWLFSYQSHRSKGRDEHWGEHAVFMPYFLSAQFPSLIHIESHTSFHYPLYHQPHLRMMFEESHKFTEAYCHHLWETVSWEKYLKDLTPELIFNKDTSYNLLARRYLDEV